jgi:sugar phosphate isomerase/epimerase
MPPLVPGLCSVTLREHPPAEVVDLARSAGLGAVEWGADVHVLPGDLAVAADVAARCADAGLRCPSYGSYLWAGAADGRGIAALGAVLDSAEALGAEVVRMWCRSGLEPQDATPEQRHQVVRDVAAVADAAAARELAVALEHHPGTLTLTADSTRALLADVDRPNLYSYWQPRPGSPPSEALDELASLLDDVAHLHVFSWGAGGERFPLGDGAELWGPALAAASDGPRRWAGTRVAYLEFVAGDDPQQLAADAATLRSWLADVAGTAPTPVA